MLTLEHCQLLGLMITLFLGFSDLQNERQSEFLIQVTLTHLNAQTSYTDSLGQFTTTAIL